MGRFSALRSGSALLRPLLRQQLPFVSPISSRSSSFISSLLSPSSPQLSPSFSSLSIPTAACLFSSFSSSRSFSSASDVPSNMVLVKSDDLLSESLQKAKDESFPAIFYFTAVWCGPCRFLWPDIKKLSESLPDVKFYKIDIDDVRSGPTLDKLEISSVPTLHFFKDGKKAAEVIGADSRKIKDITSSLYRNNPSD